MALARFKNSSFYKKHKYRLVKANDLLSLFSALALILFLCGDKSHTSLQRDALSNEIRSTAVVTGIYTGVFKINDDVIKAIARVPRHHYVNRSY